MHRRCCWRITGFWRSAVQSRAAHLIISLEEAAEMMLLAERLGGSKPFPPGALQQVRDRIRAFV